MGKSKKKKKKSKNNEQEKPEDVADLLKEFALDSLSVMVRDSEHDRHQMQNDQLLGTDFSNTLFEPSSGHRVMTISDLSKTTKIGDLYEKTADLLEWKANELRLWDGFEYERFINDESNPWNRSKYRVDYPTPLEDMKSEVFPTFVTNQLLIVERIEPKKLKFPKSSNPKIYDSDCVDWLKSKCSDWKDENPPKDPIFKAVDIPTLPRFTPSNTLFSSVGYLLDRIVFPPDEALPVVATAIPRTASSSTQPDPEVKVDESKLPNFLPNPFRSDEIRKEISEFVLENETEIDISGFIQTKSKLKCSAKEFSQKVLQTNYSGSNVDLWICAIQNGCIIQVFDVFQQKMNEFGKGFVEYFGNPNRFGPKFILKLVRWKDGEFDPITFSTSEGTTPEQNELPFHISYSLLTFEWMKNQNPNSIKPIRLCSHCKSAEKPSESYSFCGNCHSVYYCSRKCQRKHWRFIHKLRCFRRDFSTEMKDARLRERNLTNAMEIETQIPESI